jgi:hypothetical protein
MHCANQWGACPPISGYPLIGLLVMIGVFSSSADVLAQSAASRGSTGVSTGSVSAASTASGASGASAVKSGQRTGNVAASNLICNLFAGSDLLAAPPATAPNAGSLESDPNRAIQFTSLWSDSHQTTVGGSTASDTTSVIATVKLPITLSAAERKQFDDAGWKPHYDKAHHQTLYCLENSVHVHGQSAPPRQGLLCVTSGE